MSNYITPDDLHLINQVLDKGYDVRIAPLKDGVRICQIRTNTVLRRTESAKEYQGVPIEYTRRNR